MAELKYLNISGLRHVISDLKAYLDKKEFIVSTALNDLNLRLIDQSLGIQYDTTTGWNSRVGYVPPAGALMIYSDYKTIEKDGEIINVPGIKIGNGNAYVQDLAFVDEYVQKQIADHIYDNLVHTNPTEKSFWNNKLNVNDLREVEEETLIFNRN